MQHHASLDVFPCRLPISSFGLVLFRVLPLPSRSIEYLMICRNVSLGYIDFMRGKYKVENKYYLMNMFRQMTIGEKEDLLRYDFDTLWHNLWNEDAKEDDCKERGYAFSEYNVSREKFLMLKEHSFSLVSLVEESLQLHAYYIEPEWGFPKGRANGSESDLECACREFEEETGIAKEGFDLIENVLPYEEVFVGSNYKCYKHTYFLAKMEYLESNRVDLKGFNGEVSDMRWMDYESALQTIRPYNVEKINMLKKIHLALQQGYFVKE